MCLCPHCCQVTVKNNIKPDDAWPSLFDGISIHFHGFSMKGFPFMDGTAYISQCPIRSGASFTYKFQVKGVATVGVGNSTAGT